MSKKQDSKKAKLLGPTDRAILYDTVSLLASNGITPFDAVTLKYNLLKKRKKPPKKTIDALYIIHKRQRAGQPFSTALKNLVPDAERSLVIAAEQGDSIEVGAQQATSLARSEASVKKNVRKAIAYPIGILTGIVAMLAFFGYSLFPIFADITPVDTWKPGAQRIYAISSNIEIWLPIAIVLIGITAHVIKRSFSKWIGQTRFIFDNILPYTIYRYYTGGIFLITLSGLMQAGVDIKKSLDIIAAQTSSLWLRFYIKKMLANIREGKPPGVSLSHKLFSEQVLDEIVIYDKASPDKFSEILGEIGQRAIEQGDEAIKSLVSKINLFGLVTAGGLMAYVFMTMFDLVNNLNQGM